MQEARELKSFGKYRLIASLGAGGMAKVYLALMAGPAGFNKLLVIKILRQDLEHLFGASTESVQMFWKEARLAARLSHPNIVQTHEVGEVNGHYFIAMEYLDGQPYSAVLSRLRRQQVPISEHLRIVSEIARALHYSHTLRSYEGGTIGIVHRDVSPHNIIATYDGQVKLLDFGVATTDDPDHVTRVGVIKGKLDYIAPEQLRGEPIDGRADIFALGAVLWEALSGHRFGGGRKVSDALKVQSRLSGSERKLGDLCPTLPEELVSIVECATALDPRERFADATTFADALDAYIVSIGERPSPQSLSAILAPLFETERAQMSEVINTQMSAIKSAPSPAASAMTRASERFDIDEETDDLPHIERDSDEGLISYMPDAPGERSSSLRGGFARAASSIPSAARTRMAAAAPRTRDMAFLMLGTMAAGAALALLWPRGAETDEATSAAVSSQQADRPAAAAANTQAGQAARAPESMAPRVDQTAQLVLLEINVAPPTAQLTIDGVSVGAPFSGQFRKDPSLHLVEAQADGYRPLKQFVKFERDQTLALALSRWSATRRSNADAEPTSPARAGEGQGAPSRRESTITPSEPASINKAAPRALVPGADIEVSSPAPGTDDIYQQNPYRKPK